MTKPIAHLTSKAKISFIVTLALYFTLLALFAAWDAVYGQTTNWPRFLVQSFPLLLLLPGLAKKNYRTFSWLCFALLFYFIFAIQNIFITTSEAGSPVSASDFRDVAFLTLVVSLFIASMMASRWLQRVTKGN